MAEIGLFRERTEPTTATLETRLNVLRKRLAGVEDELVHMTAQMWELHDENNRLRALLRAQ